ncbi:MAG: hypothetical protein IM331_05115 [Microcystis sp. M038S1]|uniref:hypothetical protein n=1 Tax=unclassified Microcystis TaxID=2643300 RepID=UPI0025899DA5|nr:MULTISPECIES: hypothetical protein [unclassified Microcystis]MCA2620411.1 hypothetical protein [Microcystis sp. M099S2]MCA2825531.1 hypothetical protein [Microcystis sp. M088S1]MCA2809654.1 hypothetical protein [Microcystis sp. M095S1]MCA2852098.1 hypothetical protein [Microcystis sp. M076S1]MCA2921395.1 hypothetical protein [Microcystis sp. M038S1]
MGKWGSGEVGKWGISTKTRKPQHPNTPTPPQRARSDHPNTQPLTPEKCQTFPPYGYP